MAEDAQKVREQEDFREQAKLREQMGRGDEAARIYDSPLVKEFFERMKASVRREFENSAPGETAAREHQWRLHQVVVLLEDCFKETIKTGKFAHKRLAEAAAAEKPGVIKRVLARVV